MIQGLIYFNEHINEIDLAAAWPLLSPQRRDHLQRYRRKADQRAGAAAYLLLCRGLQEEYGIKEKPVFDFGPQGKPFISAFLPSTPLPHSEIHFNLSHCAEAAACVIDSFPVGIDVEAISAYDPQLLPLTMSPAEQQAIREAEHPERVFTCLWTMKEAAFKCLGTGLTDDLPSLLIGLQPSALTGLSHDSANSLILKQLPSILPFSDEDASAYPLLHPRFHFMTAISADLRFAFTACRLKN